MSEGGGGGTQRRRTNQRPSAQPFAHRKLGLVVVTSATVAFRVVLHSGVPHYCGLKGKRQFTEMTVQETVTTANCQAK